ncbi:YicC/YloC family endoribonuclease [Rariglobus hedericola]|uniref:YicC family protein n=1 Tax=Rariglobus hedericola TaxID=2597822 RepID=A0A556QMG1_9BACT|nr:YicC/YloC family endoribonuclease [Rariglobus hedericola]TSJ77840.1 YicC family protein [Rariglobus hedericola]
MKSMTGYGRASAPLGTHTLTVQVSSVNRKTLDLTVKLPREWESLEPLVGELVRQNAMRGKVHVDVELTGAAGVTEIDWDETAAAALFKRLAQFASSRGVTFTPTPELLLTLLNSQRKGSSLPDVEIAEPVLAETLAEALKSFASMRAKEGSTLLVDFMKRLETLTGHVNAVAARAPQVAAGYRDALHKRLREAGLELDVSDERVLKEIALFADRCDITEELTRLRSHFDQFTALLKSGGEIGRKSEFILQEIGREVHTIGSKANDLEISKNVIELKNELERIREQIANVE